MSTARYETVSSVEDHASSHADSTPSRLTPDSGVDEDGYIVDDFRPQEGYELKELGPDGRGAAAAAAAAAARGPRGAEGDNETGDSNDDDDNGAEYDLDDLEELDEVDDAEIDDALFASGSRRRRGRASSAHSFELYTPDEERRVRRKLDTRLVLFVALLYMMSFLDRSNIGNAKLAGLAEDLHLDDNQYEWLLTAFYITYVLFEWMTLCYKLFPPHIYISCCVAAWGVLASLQALSNSFAFMLVLRALLGIGEAAFVGIPIYLSFFFRRDEMAFRTGLFISAAPLATSFASSLAWAIMRFGGAAGIASWRLLFLLEGFPACIVAAAAWHWLPDAPSSARWLSARERRVAALRMRSEGSAADSTNNDGEGQTGKPGKAADVPRHRRRFQWAEVARTLADPKAYLTAAMFFACNVAFSSMPVFLPTIVSQMGYSAVAAQALAAPPFLFAFGAVLATALLSDRLRSRSVPMAVHALVAMLGYIFLAVAGALQVGHVLRYLAVFPICAGFFSAVTIVITWTINNQASDEGKGTGMALLNVVGQMGPLLGTRLYPDSDAPYYVKGMSVCAVAMAAVAVLAIALRIVLLRENRKRRGRRPVAEGEALVGRAVEAEFIYIT